MERQKEIFQVYNFEMSYHKTSIEEDKIKFYAVPLGVYFKPKRQTQTRESILREYAEGILDAFRQVLVPESITSHSL